MAMASLSTAVYCHSAKVRFLLTYMTGCSSPLNSWERTVSRPVLEVLQCTRKGCEESGFRSTGALVMVIFCIEKARSAIVVHWTLSSSPFLVKSEIKEAIEEKLATNYLWYPACSMSSLLTWGHLWQKFCTSVTMPGKWNWSWTFSSVFRGPRWPPNEWVRAKYMTLSIFVWGTMRRLQGLL